MLSQLFILYLMPLLALATPKPIMLNKRAIICLKVGTTSTAKWTNSAGKSCTFSGVVGSNYGSNLAGSGDYSCNGRCGSGCSGTALGNVYTADCFSHDMCSYFNSASGGTSDPNCGAAYSSAIDDTIGGLAAGCSQNNPSSSASKPSKSPTCV